MQAFFPSALFVVLPLVKLEIVLNFELLMVSQYFHSFDEQGDERICFCDAKEMGGDILPEALVTVAVHKNSRYLPYKRVELPLSSPWGCIQTLKD